MTSWNRGRENEMSGERKMNSDDFGDNVEGAVQKVAGEVEQGVDNVGDWATGRQDEVAGDVDAGDQMRAAGGSAANDAGQWLENRGDDARDALNDNDRDANRNRL